MPPLVELSPAQLRTMASAARAEIVALLDRDGPRSVREMAARFGRPVTGLYHHVEQLERAGLVRVASVRPGRRRPEKIYALVSRRLSARTAARTKPGRAALAKVARRFLIAAARSVSDALLSNTATTEGAARDTGVRRIHVRLRGPALAQFNADLDALLARAQVQSGAKGKKLELTIALAPAPARERG